MNSSKSMYLYGAGGHAKVIHGILRDMGITVKGVFDDNPAGAKLRVMEVANGIRAQGKDVLKLDAPLIISVGNNQRRSELAALIHADYGTAVHPSAIIAPDAVIGEGTVVLQGSIVQTGTRIGSHVLINTACSIDHDNVIGDFAHVSPKAALCGHVEIGEGTHIGVGAVVIQCVRIGRWCTIGAGAVVLKDVPDCSTVVGNPGRIIKTEQP